MTEFSQLATQSLGGYYVYALIDPRTNEVFYIGKGSGNRVFQHELEINAQFNQEKEKHLKIKDIYDAGMVVKKVILKYGLTEQESFSAEASLINLLNYLNPALLTNIMNGHHGDSALAVEDFEKWYGALPISTEDIKHNILVIKVNKRYDAAMDAPVLKESVRGHWVISQKNAEKVDYIFALYNGLIVGVYENMTWYPSGILTDSYPRPDEFDGKLTNRKYCTCDIVSPESEIGKMYLYKSIKELSKTTQNPISYIWGRSNRASGNS